METKVHLFCQGEENTDLSDDGYNSFATDLPSRNIDSKKYIKFSKTTEKRISPEVRGLSPEHTKKYETSMFLFGKEKSSDFSGEKKGRRKKSLQVQLHTKRTEIASSSVKDKMTRKESSLCELSSQYSVHKTLSPLGASSSVIRCLNHSLQKTCKIFSKIRGGKIYVNDLPMIHRILNISISDSEMRKALKTIDIDGEIGLWFSISCDISDFGIQLNTKSLQNHTIMKGNDDLEFKRSKNILQIRKFQDEVDSSDVEFQEPYSKDGINFKRSSEKVEIHDSKSKPQNLKSVTSLKKSLDKSDIFSIPKLQKPAVRRRASLLKHVLSKEKTAINALGNVCEAINKLENYIDTEEPQSILISMITVEGLYVKIGSYLDQMDTKENGMVKLDDVVHALSKEQNLPGYDALTDVIKAIDKIKDENFDYGDLNTCLQNFGVYLSKPEFQKITELTEAGETKKVNFKEFVDTMMSNMERFSEKLLLPDTIENLHNLSKEKMSAPDLWNTLSSLKSNLKKDEFLAALKLATVDEGDKVQIEEFAKVVKDMHDISRLEELREIVLGVDLPEGDMIPGKDLEGFLRAIGIKSPKEEVEKILQSDFVSEDNMVNVKDCMKALRDTQKFSNFIGFRKETLSSNLKLPKADEIKEAAHILSHVDNGKIGIPNLQCALKSLNVNLTEEDFSEAVKCCDTSNNAVDLKDFLKEIFKSPHFKESIDEITSQSDLLKAEIKSNYPFLQDLQ
ncbi:LOW QUALITY PROTEIN: EF-hand calcium-binding domain-containing protein 13 [Megaptera novaeangliae]